MLDGICQETSMEGSDPSGAGPIAGLPGSSFGGVGVSHGRFTKRCNSIRSPLSKPVKLLFPDLKATRSPSTLPSTMGLGTSSPPKNPAPPSTVPVSFLPSCRSGNPVLKPPIMEMKSADGPADARTGLHRPVTPDPDGTSRSHPATCGRSFTGLAAMVMVDEARPADVASTVIFPAALEDCTSAMQKPENAFRDVPLSGA